MKSILHHLNHRAKQLYFKPFWKYRKSLAIYWNHPFNKEKFILSKSSKFDSRIIFNLVIGKLWIWIAKWGKPDYYVPLSDNTIINDIINYDRYYFNNQHMVKLQENYYLNFNIGK